MRANIIHGERTKTVYFNGKEVGKITLLPKSISERTGMKWSWGVYDQKGNYEQKGRVKNYLEAYSQIINPLIDQWIEEEKRREYWEAVEKAKNDPNNDLPF